jgi:hypothetical protein
MPPTCEPAASDVRWMQMPVVPGCVFVFVPACLVSVSPYALPS